MLGDSWHHCVILFSPQITAYSLYQSFILVSLVAVGYICILLSFIIVIMGPLRPFRPAWIVFWGNCKQCLRLGTWCALRWPALIINPLLTQHTSAPFCQLWLTFKTHWSVVRWFKIPAGQPLPFWVLQCTDRFFLRFFLWLSSYYYYLPLVGPEQGVGQGTYYGFISGA